MSPVQLTVGGTGSIDPSRDHFPIPKYITRMSRTLTADS